MAQPNPIQTFLLEADDLLATIEQITLDLDGATADIDTVNQLFRAFHTIKGSGAMFGFDAVASFTHHVETALDLVREGKLSLSPVLITCVLGAKDQIKALLDEAQGGPAAPAGACDKIIATLAGLSSAKASHDNHTKPASTAPIPTPGAKQAWKIKFQPNSDLLICGTNPIALLDELRALGECSVEACTGQVPPLDQLSPDRCHFSWDIALRTTADFNTIKDVFIFVEDGSTLSITLASPSAVKISPTPVPATTQPSPATSEIASAPATSRVPAPAPVTATPEAKAVARKAVAADSTIRVPSEKLDRLVNLVGELVMNQSRLSQVAARLDTTELTSPVESIERLINELRDNVLGIRMMPIGSTFSRFKRLVHDLSAELGKEIDLVTEGAETEVDKTVLDRLGDPLIHLIRNSLDHGIELADQREKLGKSRRGTLRLAAAHTGSNVVITIQDDGKGLDRDAIRRKGIEKGLVAPDAVLSDREVFGLIFLPGFSTAKQITSVSGRGVGMDVVKRQIDTLRGSVAVASEVGRGTTISLTLPLTLAIVDGLVVAVGDDQFVIPTSVVMENLEITRDERAAFNGRHAVAVRGELVPYIRLREVFTMPENEPDLEKVVVVQHAGERVGLVVDRVLGSHQTVIQPLGRFYRDISVLSGATIMGDGRVALILDVAGLVRLTETTALQTVSTS
ncbi:MAG TPA: chemotaxis protein CheA [Lacunisphaera sp.]|jgi:two-component system chemotaxis sensor kinase CheA